MSVKTSLLTLRPGLTLLTSLFVGVLALVIGLVSVPASAHATATTPSGYTAALRRAEGLKTGPSALLRIDSVEGAPVRLVGTQGDADIRSSDVLTTYVYLPFIVKAQVCQPIPGESYGDLSVNSAPTNPPAEEHPDLNLALRGYELTNAYKGLVDYSGGGDPNAPQLPGLFADNRTATFSTVYQVYSWDVGTGDATAEEH